MFIIYKNELSSWKSRGELKASRALSSIPRSIQPPREAEHARNSICPHRTTRSLELSPNHPQTHPLTILFGTSYMYTYTYKFIYSNLVSTTYTLSHPSFSFSHVWCKLSYLPFALYTWTCTYTHPHPHTNAYSPCPFVFVVPHFLLLRFSQHLNLMDKGWYDQWVLGAYPLQSLLENLKGNMCIYIYRILFSFLCIIFI